ncbi:MAG: hypothetical protein IKF72_07540 [Kiritimatiellae bacterium]|nr:hypothetical protein [Kiritimatiellia bacterium]
MGKVILSRRTIICYNTPVLRKRGELIFDIGGRQIVAPATGPKPAVADGKTSGDTAAHISCANRPEELRKRIRRPQHVRYISVLGFVVKPLTFQNEKPNTMVRRVYHTRRTFFSRFSLRFLEAPSTRRDSEGAPLFISASKQQHPVW